MRTIKGEQIRSFREYLTEEERAAATVGKYEKDVVSFAVHLSGRELTKNEVLSYKNELIGHYAPASVNSILSSLNSFFAFMGWHDLRVKLLKIQRRTFASGERELTRAEYERLLRAACDRKNERLYLIMQTVCATGIRVSELRYITVEAVEQGRAEIRCKGKQRTVLLPRQLCKLLNQYIKTSKRKSGPVFVTKHGNPPDRSNIWSDMKRLCRTAGVPREKVFPHNLRHLFARTYYSLQKDIVRLADILGHSSVNTTRIYTMESGEVHRRQIERLGLLRC